MCKALKEEYVPESWKRWGEQGTSRQVAAETVSPDSVPVDIIAVQGLASTYEWTWTKQLNDGSSVMWLRDLLPKDLPDARIMSFEYDSKWLRDPALVDLEDCGNRLLESVIWDRSHWKSEQMCPIMARRPLILIGHSYGGLVIKQALVTAAAAEKEDPNYADYQSFITAVAGVMFLGTPHNGSSAASVGLVQAEFSKFLGQTPNIDILKPLVIDSTLDVLRRVEESFQKILGYNDRLSELLVAYFYEKKPLKLGPFKMKVVVTQESACYGSRSRSQNVELDANHMEMNKFGSRDESNYQRLLRRLTKFHKDASQIVEARLGKYEYDTCQPAGDVMEIKQWLSPGAVRDEIYDRRKTDRLDGTCEWAYDVEVLRTWLHMDSLPSAPSARASPAEGQAVWVSGKAGSGKSVFAVYLHDRISETYRGNNWSATDISRCSGSSETIDCQHYSVASNKAALYVSILKTSTSASTIRTLIHQLLSFQPTRSELHKIVMKAKRNFEECTTQQGKNIFRVLLQFFPLVHIIIDGLDECEKPKDLVELFKDISQQGNVCILFLARQDQELEHIALRDIPGLQMMDIINYNNSDIFSFIQNAVSQLALVNNAVSADAPSVMEQILRDARGMFQWVNLVLYDLQYANTRDDVFKKMNRFPRELNEAYAKTFHRLNQAPGFEPDILSLVLKLLTASYQAFTWDDLAMAVQLQKELDRRRRRDHRRRLDPQSLQECIETAVEKIGELPDSYFSFLGPLIDIRFSASNSEVPSSKPSRMVTLCHHSLYQWIEGSEHSVNHEASWWKQVHFTRTQAHETLAGLTLAMMSSRTMLCAHLQDLYAAARCPIPFLNYSGQFWFAHLRAVGALAELALLTAAEGQFQVEVAPMSLSDLIQMVLDNNMDISAGVCAALSSSLGAVSIHKVRNLPKVIALRGLELALLPASKSIASVKKTLPKLRNVAEKLQAQKAFSGRKHRDLFVHEASKSLGPKLDSETALHVLHTTKYWEADSTRPDFSHRPSLKSQISLLCQGARDLRRLAILLAVDPVRGWIYAQIGESGISPLAALALASEAIDTYLAASFLTPELFTSYDMADQFNTQVGHPYHGLVSAARYELATERYNGFNSEFYRENIMEHYRISKWEWSTIRILLAAMEMSSSNAHEMHVTLRGWVADHNLFPRDSDGNDKLYISPIDLVSKVPFQKFSGRAITTKQSLGLLMSATAAFVFKYLTHVCPPLEDILLDMRRQFLFATGTLRPALGYLFTNWEDCLFASGFYLLRCRYAPWLFGYVRTSPWEDLRGVIDDPEGYIPAASSPYGYGWIPMIPFIVQYAFIIFLTLNDVATAVAIDSKTGDVLPTFRRRTSFRLNWAHDNAPPILLKLEHALETYGFHWFSSFRRIIVIEMVVLAFLYWIFDLIRSSAVAVTSTLWSWKGAMAYALQFIGYTYGRTAGFVNVVKLYIRGFFWIYLLVRYRDTSLAGYLYRWVLLPASTFLFSIFQGSIRALAARRDSFLALLDSLEGLIVHAIKQIEPRILIFSVAIAIPCLGLLLWYIFSDPLALESAAQSCSKAGKVSKELTGIENPADFLKWNGANNTDPTAIIAFTGSLEDLEMEI